MLSSHVFEDNARASNFLTSAKWNDFHDVFLTLVCICCWLIANGTQGLRSPLHVARGLPDYVMQIVYRDDLDANVLR